VNRFLISQFVLLLGVVSMASGAARSVEGVVLSVDRDASRIALQLPGIDGAEGEVVEARVVEGDAEILRVSQPIRGQLFQSMGAWRLEQIWPADPVQNRLLEETSRQLRRETARLRRRDFRNIGDYLPPFALWNQNGELVTANDLRGNPFVVNFIFTRCQVDRMCPASSRRMVELQQALVEAELNGARLVTISFDPAFDTPGVLTQYARSYGMDLDRFTLLTGPQAVISDLLIQFGIITVEEDGTIDHTMATLLVDETGRIVHRREGSNWRVAEFLERLQSMDSSRL
jgi:protein SCO1/2